MTGRDITYFPKYLWWSTQTWTVLFMWWMLDRGHTLANCPRKNITCTELKDTKHEASPQLTYANKVLTSNTICRCVIRQATILEQHVLSKLFKKSPINVRQLSQNIRLQDTHTIAHYAWGVKLVCDPIITRVTSTLNTHKKTMTGDFLIEQSFQNTGWCSSCWLGGWFRQCRVSMLSRTCEDRHNKVVCIMLNRDHVWLNQVQVDILNLWKENQHKQEKMNIVISKKDICDLFHSKNYVIACQRASIFAQTYIVWIVRRYI